MTDFSLVACKYDALIVQAAGRARVRLAVSLDDIVKPSTNVRCATVTKNLTFDLLRGCYRWGERHSNADREDREQQVRSKFHRRLPTLQESEPTLDYHTVILAGA